MTQHLETIEEVISALGGDKSLAEITGRTAISADPTWRYRNQFPARTFTTMKSELEKRGLSAPNKLWGMP